MARKASKSLTAAVSAEIKSNFDLGNFKNKKGLTGSVKFKAQQWIPLSPAFQSVTSVPGIPTGHICLLRGHSDTGKTTALIEAAIACQKSGVLPVFIVTEMKWNWEHATQMGLQLEEVWDESTGELIDYKGFFIYADREHQHPAHQTANNRRPKSSVLGDIANFRFTKTNIQVKS